jgi:hypothetical protein
VIKVVRAVVWVIAWALPICGHDEHTGSVELCARDIICVVMNHWYVLPYFPSGFDTRYLGQTLSGGLKRQLLESHTALQQQISVIFE